MAAVHPDTADDSDYENRKSKENETLETEMVHENAWDLFCTASQPRHELYQIGCESCDSIPVITKTTLIHGLRGLNPGDVIEIIGNEQSGKSQFLYQYAIDCCLPSKLTVIESTENGKPTVLDLHGHNSRSFHFDLLQSFSIDRLHDIFINVLFRKIHRHNERIDASPAIKNEGKRAPPMHRHSMPLRLNQRNVTINKQRIRRLKINALRFEKSSECRSLWKLVTSRIEVVIPQTPIQLIVALHKMRRNLKELYTAKIPDHHEMDFDQLNGCDMDQFEEMDIDHDGNQRDPKDTELEAMLKEQRECTIQNLILSGDDGMRLVLIDDSNAFFNELTATHERDRYYNSFSSNLMDLCSEYGLFVVFSRFTAFKKEREWLKYMMPMNDLRPRAVRNYHYELKPEDTFHKKCGSFSLETKALFIVFVYREPLELVDSTVTHPSITNDLFRPDSRFGDEMSQRIQYNLGHFETTKRWMQTLDITQLDPLEYIQAIQQRENRREFGVEEFNVIRGMVVTGNEYISRARRKKQQYDVDYEHAVVKKQMIRFNVRITNDCGFVYNMN